MEKGGFGKVFRNNLFNRLKTFKTLFTSIIIDIYSDPKCKLPQTTFGWKNSLNKILNFLLF